MIFIKASQKKEFNNRSRVGRPFHNDAVKYQADNL